MTIACRFKDGTFKNIPCIMWHPQFDSNDSNSNAGLWAFVKDIDGYLSKYNKTFMDIDIAEAPIDLYLDCDDSMPWKHNGLKIKTIRFDASLPYEYWLS